MQTERCRASEAGSDNCLIDMFSLIASMGLRKQPHRASQGEAGRPGQPDQAS